MTLLCFKILEEAKLKLTRSTNYNWNDLVKGTGDLKSQAVLYCDFFIFNQGWA